MKTLLHAASQLATPGYDLSLLATLPTYLIPSTLDLELLPIQSFSKCSYLGGLECARFGCSVWQLSLDTGLGWHARLGYLDLILGLDNLIYNETKLPHLFEWITYGILSTTVGSRHKVLGSRTSKIFSVAIFIQIKYRFDSVGDDPSRLLK